jgi:hypothetical protein
MKKLSLSALCAIMCMLNANAYGYQLQSSKEFGHGEARNQNVVVKCTTETGQVSSQTCSFRRYANCAVNESGAEKCAGWQPWRDMRNQDAEFSDWKAAAVACCRAQGLR